EAMHGGGRWWIGDSELLRQGGGGEEDLHELARDVRHRELSEQLRLSLQARGHAVPQSVLDGFERGERSGIVASRLRQHLLAGRAEHQPPAERIAVEQPAEEATGRSEERV